MSAYSSSKGAVIAYAKSVGKEHALSGITVNSLAPATIRTAMLASMDKQQVKALTDKIPMRRYIVVQHSRMHVTLAGLGFGLGVGLGAV